MKKHLFSFTYCQTPAIHGLIKTSKENNPLFTKINPGWKLDLAIRKIIFQSTWVSFSFSNPLNYGWTKRSQFYKKPRNAVALHVSQCNFRPQVFFLRSISLQESLGVVKYAEKGDEKDNEMLGWFDFRLRLRNSLGMWMLPTWIYEMFGLFRMLQNYKDSGINGEDFGRHSKKVSELLRSAGN